MKVLTPITPRPPRPRRRRLWLSGITICVVAVGVWLGSLALPLSGQNIAHSGSLLWQAGVAMLEARLTPNQRLQRHTVKAIATLEREIDRLQWREAESTVVAQSLTAELDRLLAQQAAASQQLLQLASWIETGSAVGAMDGQSLNPAQLEQLGAQKLVEFTTLQEQVALYQRTQTLHAQAASRARTLWIEARQSIKTMQAYLELLSATAALQSTTSQLTGEGAAFENIETMTAGLRSQLERDRKISERRQALEATLTAEPTVGAPRKDAATNRSTLVEELRTLAAQQERLLGRPTP